MSSIAYLLKMCRCAALVWLIKQHGHIFIITYIHYHIDQFDVSYCDASHAFTPNWPQKGDKPIFSPTPLYLNVLLSTIYNPPTHRSTCLSYSLCLFLLPSFITVSHPSKDKHTQPVKRSCSAVISDHLCFHWHWPRSGPLSYLFFCVLPFYSAFLFLPFVCISPVICWTHYASPRLCPPFFIRTLLFIFSLFSAPCKLLSPSIKDLVI